MKCRYEMSIKPKAKYSGLVPIFGPWYLPGGKEGCGWFRLLLGGV